MNFSEFLDKTEGVEPVLTIEDARENEVKVCPKGYRMDLKTKRCVPKTDKDDVRSGRGQKDSHPNNGPGYNVWGRTGVNGDGYAWAERNDWGNGSSQDSGAVE